MFCAIFPQYMITFWPTQVSLTRAFKRVSVKLTYFYISSLSSRTLWRFLWGCVRACSSSRKLYSASDQNMGFFYIIPHTKELPFGWGRASHFVTLFYFRPYWSKTIPYIEGIYLYSLHKAVHRLPQIRLALPELVIKTVQRLTVIWLPSGASFMTKKKGFWLIEPAHTNFILNWIR